MTLEDLKKFDIYATLRNWAGNYFGYNLEISDLKVINNSLNEQLAFNKKRVAELSVTLSMTADKAAKELAELKAQLLQVSELENSINSRRPKINHNYQRHETDKDYGIDVRNFMMPWDANIPLIAGHSNDNKAYNALMWVIDNVKYTSDKGGYGYDEYWAFPYQTFERRIGDCEDGAILLASMMLKSGIPYFRVNLNAGSVNGGGHAYVSYCRETDNEFIVLDWCYWPNRLPIEQRPLHKDERNYLDKDRNFYVWFSWNQKYCFGELRTMTGLPKDFKQV